MLKIYLDWNVITHCKKGDIYENILNLIEACGDKYIFPYSNAHIRDFSVNPQARKDDYYKDINTFKAICKNHLLEFDKGLIVPSDVISQDYLDKRGGVIEFMQNYDYITLSEYEELKIKFKELIPEKILKRIQGADTDNVIQIIDDYLASNTTYKSLEDLMCESLHKTGELNLETQIKSICLGLDLFGYRPEKKIKKIMNIDTDASHIAFAAFCDYFVTADKRLSAKAKAIYSHYGKYTSVIHPQELEKIINDDLQNEFSLSYAIDCIDKYGIPRIEGDNAYYQFMRTPLFGIFNTCHKADSNFGYKGCKKCGIFRYSFNHTPYLFKSELEKFLNFFRDFMPNEHKDYFQTEYANPMLSTGITNSFIPQFEMVCSGMDLQIKLSIDPSVPVPCPMMYIIAGEGVEEKVLSLSKRLLERL